MNSFEFKYIVWQNYYSLSLTLAFIAFMFANLFIYAGLFNYGLFVAILGFILWIIALVCKSKMNKLKRIINAISKIDSFIIGLKLKVIKKFKRKRRTKGRRHKK